MIAAIIYLSVIFLAFLLQTRLIFFPSKLSRDHSFRTDVPNEEVFLQTADNEQINGLFFPGSSEKVILYFHGNAGSLEGWQHVYDQFQDLHLNVFMIDYRGYGKSTGSISEQGLNTDGRAAYDYLITRGFGANDIIVYGRSLGSGIAVQLASTAAVGALILEAPYVSMKKLAWEKMPLLLPGFYIRYRFDNLKRINKIKAPLLVIHGEADSTIPYSHGKKLFDTFNGQKKMISIPGAGHNDLDTFAEFRSAIAAFLR
jgi:fermentation-respiration switch protein FrsA (DUF1100 family)